ncbi:hypothetical protein ASE00_00625 [Sphingomonas sp. Root710]|uniref:DUF3489 domain-containing protein n=1 Tax=Sphingomonas sp. Root710 TaxID=1736594 RepID=UPI000700B564|nr:DUF3489 domain-containing protein [Sphingomonas sp. Root710]KRB85346.1 hypothetical protein ASE00_00625 [Sphingomonas sp. Root710]
MALKPDLEDLQLILLTAAAKTEGGSILPAPAHIAQYDVHVREAVGLLVDRGLADEVNVDEPEMSYRADDENKFGAIISEAGRETAEISGPAPDHPEMKPARRGRKPVTESTAAPPPPAAPIPKLAGGKQAKVIQMLNRKQGASLDQIMEATGWLAHSARAVLSGLRKKGYEIDRTTTPKGSVYRIAKAG